ncbi:hypothetical protein F2Q69_00033719 [Brassica cretica]|uniref:Uncharacterized protein n=2 Tax=Brassica cretica TaxID=69181 RepID=A0A8S9SH34_BRACR|nr:hypothetical protein F2Q69_00033719 [Brassica cretica]
MLNRLTRNGNHLPYLRDQPSPCCSSQERIDYLTSAFIASDESTKLLLDKYRNKRGFMFLKASGMLPVNSFWLNSRSPSWSNGQENQEVARRSDYWRDQKPGEVEINISGQQTWHKPRT